MAATNAVPYPATTRCLAPYRYSGPPYRANTTATDPRVLSASKILRAAATFAADARSVRMPSRRNSSSRARRETLKFPVPDGEYRAVNLRSLAAVETRDVTFAFEDVELP